MKIKVNTRNLNRKKRINAPRLGKIAARVLKELGKDHVELNLVFVSNQKIRALNRRWFGRDNSTDVIAWPSGEDGLCVKRHASRLFLGDIAISSDKAVQNAKEYGNTFMAELTLYVIHGILHLLGYDDMTPDGREKMRRMEDEVSEKIRTLV